MIPKRVKRLLFVSLLLISLCGMAQPSSGWEDDPDQVRAAIPVLPNTPLILGKGASDWQVAAMNYTSVTAVQRYAKLELGISLPEPYKSQLERFIERQLHPSSADPRETVINPFLEWELDVEATFTHVGTSTEKTLDAFFTRDMQRNYRTKLWNEVPSDYHMRIRFAPPETGQWNCTVRIKIGNEEFPESITFPITVAESGKHGYITVHPNRKNFQLDGTVIYPVGQNLPHTDEYQEGTPYDIYNGITEFKNNIDGWQAYIDLIDNYGKLGGRFTRIFMTTWSGLIEWEEKGNYFRRMHQAYELDNILEKMEEHDMYTIFDLLLHNYFMMYSDYNKWDWDWDRHMICTDPNGCGDGIGYLQRWYPTDQLHAWEKRFPVHPYNDRPGNYLDPNQHPKLPHEMFLLEDDLKYHEQRTRYYISRYGYSTQIYIWEQVEEPFHIGQDGILGQGNYPNEDEPYFNPDHPLRDTLHTAIATYITRMHTYIREHMRHEHQLLGVNAVQRYGKDALIGQHDPSITDKYTDCVGLNPYFANPNDLIINAHSDPKNNTRYLPDENTCLAKISLFGNNFRNTGADGAAALPNPYPHPDFSAVKRPVYFSECGADAGIYGDKVACQNGTDEWIDNLRLGFTGAAGFNKWHRGFDNRYGVWQHIVLSDSLMNNPDMRNVLETADYLQGRQCEELTGGGLKKGRGATLEMQYYLRSDRSMAVGYIHNRSANYLTAGAATPCGAYPQQFDNLNAAVPIDWKAGGPFKKLKLTDLTEKTTYQVDFYAYPDGKHMASYSTSSGTGGKFTLEFPVLDRTTPLVWFVCRKM